ncbi:hypothetical protein AVEN_95569-1 [Araneus ventricosus]|uniref:DNA-directed DNA polymerase n=1 Tax=Araneus ventricosus TaxID=182803 RepID=A0A4Y2PFM8_ARAVE|nr:hypothetical protein AVEN_95569-1 [Araneus ventricosus]
MLLNLMKFHLDETLRMEITTIRQPVGAGRIRKVVNVECNRLNKRSMLCIPTDSLGLCCAKPIVSAIAHLYGDRRSISAMKDRRRPALETRARELHKKAGIPLGPCTFAEVAGFEEVLDIQIIVISIEERNGCDGQFIVGWMLEQGTSPSVILIGSKLMPIRHPSLGINIIDSMSFLPMSLSKLPNCFGLSELKKGYFPHLFSVRENQNYVEPLPSQQFYCADSMSPSALAVFMSWHADHENDQFDFQKEMLEYCRYVFY